MTKSAADPKSLPAAEKPAGFVRNLEEEWNRLLRRLRANGHLTHEHLVEVLGAEDVEVDHKAVDHPVGEDPRIVPFKVFNPEKQEEELRKSPSVPVGKASVAVDSHTSRAWVEGQLGNSEPAEKLAEIAAS